MRLQQIILRIFSPRTGRRAGEDNLEVQLVAYLTLKLSIFVYVLVSSCLHLVCVLLNTVMLSLCDEIFI